LTLEEQRTQLTLWAIARSPLILGANLTMLDAPALKMLTNADLVRVNQTAQAARQAFHDGDLVGWAADLPNGEKAIAVFNLSSASQIAKRPLTDFGIEDHKWMVRDAWVGVDLGNRKDVSVKLAGHECALWILR
jgi:hypothetical protein